MDKQAFFNECKKHDWFYNYSDDSRVWNAGRVDKDRLLAIASNKPELKSIWEAWAEHMFSGKDFGKEPKPKPTLADFGIVESPFNPTKDISDEYPSDI